MRRWLSLENAFFRSFKIAALAGVALFASVAIDGGQAAEEILIIRDDETGGDCVRVGLWSSPSKTCTMTVDFSGKFVIASDGVSLDGAGHTVTGIGPEALEDFKPGPDGGGDAVYIYGRTGVTVKNINFKRFDYSVNIEYSSGVTVTGITTSASGLAGISLDNATDNVLTNNTISNPGTNTGICVGYQSTGNTITDNIISGNDRGIYLHTSCTGNLIARNRLSDNDWNLTMFEGDSSNTLEANFISGGGLGIYLNDHSNNNVVRENTVQGVANGIRLENVSGSSVYHNNFTDNAVQAQATGGVSNSFNLESPQGGNYWSDFDSMDEGCSDSNGDGFCDAPYGFAGGGDAWPWVKDEGWTCGRPSLGLGAPVTFWASYGDYQMRLLSIQWMVNNLGGNKACNVAVTDSSCTRGVIVHSTMPVSVGDVPGGFSRNATLKYHVPIGVTSFRTSLGLMAGDLCGGIHNYGSPSAPGA